MIITVTMNPAIDKTIDIGTFIHGGLNRISHIEKDAGGKGINVSKTIHHLGGASLATGFLGGDAGDFIERSLISYGIQTDFIHVDGETRTNTKVVEVNGIVTELNEPGPQVPEEKINELIQKLESYASPDTLAILAGSIPAGMDKNIYRIITEKMHAKGASVLLDADGELFVQALKAKPDIIKPNRVELTEYFSRLSAHDADTESHSATQHSLCSPETVCIDISNDEDALITMGNFLLSSGIRQVIISMGGDGALFLNGTQVLQSAALPVQTHSTVGAGDAMVAALAYGWEQKLPFEECARLAMAASAGAVTTVGTKPPAGELIEELKQQVVLESLHTDF